MKTSYFICILFSITSCVVYPDLKTIPLISNQNEIVLHAGITTSPSSINSTISYGIKNNLTGQSFGIVNLDGYYMQQSFGYYIPIQNLWIFENYYGFGIGKGHAFFGYDGTSINGLYHDYITQLNIGKKATIDSHFEYGLGLQTGLLQSNFKENYYDNKKYNELCKNSLEIKPQIFMRWGKSKLRFNIQIGSLWIYEFTEATRNIPYSPLNIGFGLQYNFN